MIVFVNRVTGTIHREEPTERCNSDAARRANHLVRLEVATLAEVIPHRKRRRMCGWCRPKEESDASSR